MATPSVTNPPPSEDDYHIEIVYDPAEEEYEWTVFDINGAEVEQDTELEQDDALRAAKRCVRTEVARNAPLQVVYTTRPREFIEVGGLDLPPIAQPKRTSRLGSKFSHLSFLKPEFLRSKHDR